MATTVVTISRQLASGGALIGQRVAQQLGFRYVDREILTRAAAALGAENELAVEHLEERARSVWGHISRAIGVGPPETPFVPPPPPPFNEGDVQQAEMQIIREIADAGRAVIVGRGSVHVLQGRADVIHVFVHAPKRVRIAEVARSYSLDETAAKAMVERSDRNRSRFVQQLTGRPWTDACFYDLSIDTSIVPPDLAVDLLVGVVNARR